LIKRGFRRRGRPGHSPGSRTCTGWRKARIVRTLGRRLPSSEVDEQGQSSRITSIGAEFENLADRSVFALFDTFGSGDFTNLVAQAAQFVGFTPLVLGGGAIGLDDFVDRDPRNLKKFVKICEGDRAGLQDDLNWIEGGHGSTLPARYFIIMRTKCGLRRKQNVAVLADGNSSLLG
jgi:hypothetical protein